MKSVVLALLAAACLPSHSGGSQSAPLMITVRVVEFTRVRVLSQPQVLEITALDVARGYVEPREPLLIEVETNAPAYTMVLSKAGEHVRGVEVAGLGTQLRFQSDTTVTRKPGARQETLQLRVRFALDRELGPGTYPWALQLSTMTM